jgi:hypothetical protein
MEERIFTKFQIKAAFEYFNSLMTKPGENPRYSQFIFNNFQALAGAYGKVKSEIYDRNTDPEFIKVAQAMNDPLPDEPAKAAAVKATREENWKKALSKAFEKETKNDAILQQQVKIQVETLTLSEFINSAPPFIVGLFAFKA